MIRSLKSMVAAALFTTPFVSPLAIAECFGGENETTPPHVAMQRPPQSPLIFTQQDRYNTERLEVKYLKPGVISFKLEVAGRCSRKENGTADIKQGWRLGTETDENEKGEEIAVQEYVYRKAGGCSMYFRIDEGDWTQATVKESPVCNRNCPASKPPLLRRQHPGTRQ